VNAILTYHSIDDSGSPISLPMAVFKEHARWLASGRVRVLTLESLASAAESDTDAVAVTFDDGFRNTSGAIELLRDAGLDATIFVVTGQVGATNAWGGREQPGIPTLPLLDWNALGDHVRRGVRIEAHTRTHPSLITLSDAQIDTELHGCRDDLRARLGIDSVHLAYPYGDVNAQVVSRTSPGFRFGYTTDVRTADYADPMRVPRIDMYYFRASGAIANWGSPAFARRLGWIRARRRIRRLLA
jgi:peptidoglycan/xylan/chitin deacetylase (PgdA/CDA1 family)